MGGMGSGRFTSRSKCEAIPAIDIREWSRQGLLKPGHCFNRHWLTNDHAVSTAQILALADGLEARYTAYGRPAAQRIQFLWTPCHFGGQRIWLQCPACNDRVAKLYLCDGRFVCRKCGNLAYLTSSMASLERAKRQAMNVRRRVGESAAIIACPFPERPPRMRHRTYELLKQLCERYEARVIGYFG